MRRDWDMSKVSDGQYYTKDDWVKADCHGCVDCSACCHGMGSSVILDPYDVYRLTGYFSCTIRELLETGVEWNPVDHLILPNLKMAGDQEACYYLGEDGRCRIHSHRPGICRLFPLGRIYEENGFRYFLQIHECSCKDRENVQVRDWLDTPNLKKYEKYIDCWHRFLKAWEKKVLSLKQDEERKQYVLYPMMQFFNKPYDTEKDFYPQFYERLEEAEAFL